MIASEQSENEFLEPTELGSRQTTLEKLEKEKRDYEEQLARSVPHTKMTDVLCSYITCMYL